MYQKQRDGSGILFKNDRKEKPTHSDYTGKLAIDGVEYWLNAWIKEGKNGKFMSLSVLPRKGARLRVVGGSNDPSDDIPF